MPSDGCPYPSTLGPDKVSGYDVLRALDIDGIHYGTYGKLETQSRRSRARLISTCCKLGSWSASRHSTESREEKQACFER